jgi:hypothetical protein
MGMEMRLLEPLHVPAFRRLATSYGLNELGWGFGTIALAVLVYDRTGSAAATTLLFLATTFLPALATPAVTARLDRLAVRRALPALYLAEAALFGALVVLSGRFWLPAIIALALADGVVALAGRALTRAAVAAALKPVDGLAAGNKLLNVLFSVAFAIGPALAGLLTAASGVAAARGVSPGRFVLMAITLATSRSLPPARTEGDPSWRRRLREGLRYVAAHTPVRRLLGAHGAMLVLFTAIVPIEVVYATESLGGSEATYGLLLTAWGAGTVLSSLALTRSRRASPVALICGAAASVGCGYLVMAAAPGVEVAMLGCVLGGAGNGVQLVSVVQAVQDRVHDDFQARVMGLLESINAAALGTGFVLGGLVTGLTDPRVTFALSGTGALLVALAARGALRGARTVEPAGLAPAPEPQPAG